MGYHAILESSNISVYRQSDCASDSQVGTLYNGEVPENTLMVSLIQAADLAISPIPDNLSPKAT